MADDIASAPSPEPAAAAAPAPSPAPVRRSDFSLRALISLSLLGLSIVLALSGVVLFYSPRGQVANWTNWRFWGITREQWMFVHINSAAVVLILVFLHVWYNWRLLWCYIRKSSLVAIHRKYELFVALGLTALVFAGSVYEWPGAQELPRWRSQLRARWETNIARPPVAHLEEWTLRQLAEGASVEADRLLAATQELGFGTPSENTTLGEIAAKLGQSPREVFESLRGKVPELDKVTVPGAGRGGGGGGGGRGPGLGSGGGPRGPGWGRGMGGGRGRGRNPFPAVPDE